MDNDYSKVKLSKLKQIVNHIEKDMGVHRDDVEVPMEYVISALFPDAYDNIKRAVTQSYMDGYKAGLKSLLEDDGK